jgi:hypothetical protein
MKLTKYPYLLGDRMRAHRAKTLKAEAEAAVAQGSKESHIESERQKSLQEAARARQEEAKADIYESVSELMRERSNY